MPVGRRTGDSRLAETPVRGTRLQVQRRRLALDYVGTARPASTPWSRRRRWRHRPLFELRCYSAASQYDLGGGVQRRKITAADVTQDQLAAELDCDQVFGAQMTPWSVVRERCI